MAEIQLSQGKIVLIDDVDFAWLNQYKWYAGKHGNTLCAMRNIQRGGKRTTQRMHRLILQPLENEDIDHKNRNGLDNRRENLRICTNSENMANQKRQPSLKKVSGFKGVFRCNRGIKRWFARIWVNKKQIYLGSTESEKEAALLYDKAAQKYFGEFANLNFQNN